jgi:hypothetical protein
MQSRFKGGHVLQVRWILLVSVLLAITWNASAQQRPLRTDDAELLQTGRVRAEFGAEFLQGQHYTLSGLEGDLSRLGVASVQVGVGEYAEFRISGVARDVLSVSGRTDQPAYPPKFTGNSTSDFGDLIFATKLKLAGEKKYRPAMAFKFGVELPNAKHDSGLGTDETEFYASLLFKKNVGRCQILADLGFAILGNPVLEDRQTDPLTYGVATIIPVLNGVNLVAEVNGRQGPPRRLGNENQSQVRAGIQFWTGKIRWDLGAVAGLMKYDPKSGVVVGATYEFQAFKRKEPAVRIQK